jgi:hypothetical protein
MRPAENVHYVLTADSDAEPHEFDTLEDACDAVVLRLPVGAAFTIRRIRARGAQEVVLRATKSTIRARDRAS